MTVSMPTDKLRLGSWHMTTSLKETTNIALIDLIGQKGHKGKTGTRDISAMRDMRGMIGMIDRDTIGMKEMIEAIEREKEIEKEVIEVIEVIVEIGMKEVTATREIKGLKEVIDKEAIETNTESSKAARIGKKIAPTNPKTTEVDHRKPLLPTHPATGHTSPAIVTHISH